MSTLFPHFKIFFFPRVCAHLQMTNGNFRANTHCLRKQQKSNNSKQPSLWRYNYKLAGLANKHGHRVTGYFGFKIKNVPVPLRCSLEMRCAKLPIAAFIMFSDSCIFKVKCSVFSYNIVFSHNNQSLCKARVFCIV